MSAPVGKSPHTPYRDSRAAFTLVELLVVIAIIALLMSILMPALAGARKQAKGVICQKNLHEWGLAFQLFAHDHDGYFPASIGSPEDYWMVGMLPYLGIEKGKTSKARDLFLCPMAAKSLNPDMCNRCPGTTFSAWGPFDATGAWWDTRAMGSYGINEWCSNPPETEDGRYWGFPSEYAWRTPDVRGGGNIPIFADCIYVDGFPLHVDEPPEYPDQYDGGSGCWAQNAMKIFCIDRHSGGPNGLFTDMSVREIGLKELWRLKWNRGFKTNEPPPVWPRWMAKFPEY